MIRKRLYASQLHSHAVTSAPGRAVLYAYLIAGATLLLVLVVVVGWWAMARARRFRDRR